jgi:hypothetical protein
MWGAVPGRGLTRGTTGQNAFGLICRPLAWDGVYCRRSGGRVPIGALPLQGTVTVLTAPPARRQRPPARADQEPGA